MWLSGNNTPDFRTINNLRGRYLKEDIKNQAQNCSLGSLCHKSKNNRIIEVNYKLKECKRRACQRLLSEEGIYHRGRRCIELEAVFGQQIKHDAQFNRFRLRCLEKVKIEFALVAIVHNLRKLAKKASLSSFLQLTVTIFLSRGKCYIALYPQHHNLQISTAA